MFANKVRCLTTIIARYSIVALWIEMNDKNRYVIILVDTRVAREHFLLI
jgi:hypothetical protein